VLTTDRNNGIKQAVWPAPRLGAALLESLEEPALPLPIATRPSPLLAAVVCGVVLLSLLLFTLMARAPLHAMAIAAISFSAMTFAGVAVVRRPLRSVSSPLALLVFGAVVGAILGRLGIIAFSMILGTGFTSGVATFVAMVAFGVAAGVGDAGRRWSNNEWRELAAIALTGSAVLIVTGLAYSGVARPTPEGYAFVPYFSWDFLQHVSVTAELARHVPPENPYFAGERFHYYWFYHLWPASLENLCAVTAKDAYIVALPFTNLMFIAALSIALRPFAPSPAVRAMAVAVALFAYSYIGELFLLSRWAPQQFSRIPNLSHAASYSQLSHSWFRDFLYEPHAITALTFLLFAVCLAQVSEVRTWKVGLLTGIALGLALTTDAFIGLVGCAWYGLMNLRNLWRSNARASVICAGVMVIVVFSAALALEIFPLRGNLLRFKLHRTALVAPIYLVIELGPLFLMGIAGLLIVLRRREQASMGAMLTLVGIGLLFAFLVQNPQEPNIVLRKSIKVLQIPLVALCGVSFAWILENRRWRIAACAAVVVLGGMLTLWSDVFQYMDVLARRFPPTTYVAEADMQMTRWIRTNTAEDSVVQVVSEVRPGRSYMDTFDFKIPALAERRALFANYSQTYISQVPGPKLDHRLSDLQSLFLAKSPEQLSDALSRLPRHYLYVDEHEPGPLDAIYELRRRGKLVEVHRVGSISLLAPKG
jgi:hypothetical protein